MINELIRYVDRAGLRQVVYDGAFPVIVVTLLAFYLLYGRKYSLPWQKRVWAWVMTIAGIRLLNPILAWVVNGLDSEASANILYAFVYFPLICLLTAKLLRVKTGVMLDYMTPSILIWHCIGQSVCAFFGCCAGISCSWGIWNPLLDRTVFPIQWTISLAVLLVFLFMLRYARKRQYNGSGRVYPIMLILTGSIRFFLEFLKDSTKIFLGMTELSFHALFMMLVGTIWLLVLEEIRLEIERTDGKMRSAVKSYL